MFMLNPPMQPLFRYIVTKILSECLLVNNHIVVLMNEVNGLIIHMLIGCRILIIR